MTPPAVPLVGCAGWSVVSRDPERFAGSGTQLEHYAQHFGAVEINSSFYRPHRRSTYQKWAGSVPESFRFSVKMPKTISHQHKLQGCEALLGDFIDESSGLGEHLGVYLLQLPPSLAFDEAQVQPFLVALRGLSAAPVACEARHVSWFTPAAQALLTQFGVSQVAADPAPCEAAALPSADLSTLYYRWHGSPRRYYSEYDLATLHALASAIRGKAAWVIFDNTASSAGLRNATQLQALLNLDSDYLR